MAYTSPTTQSTGTLVTAAIWNRDLVDNFTAAVEDTRCVVSTVAASGTTTSTSYTTPSSGAQTTTAVTIPASGQILVSLSVRGSVTANAAYASLEVFDESLVQVAAPSDAWSVTIHADAGATRQGITHLFTGTAGDQRRFSLRVRNSNAGQTSTWQDRTIIVRPIA